MPTMNECRQLRCCCRGDCELSGAVKSSFQIFDPSTALQLNRGTCGISANVGTGLTHWKRPAADIPPLTGAFGGPFWRAARVSIPAPWD